MTLAKAKAKTNETFIVQASLTIITYNRQKIFIVQATGEVKMKSAMIVGIVLDQDCDMLFIIEACF
jgi:hypothetical protein